MIIASFGAGGAALAADAQAGRSVAQSKCAECHDADDWEGEDAASLESLIRDIVAGKVKHKRKLELGAARSPTSLHTGAPAANRGSTVSTCARSVCC
jgi:mono/diheme cytochrome c family protein